MKISELNVSDVLVKGNHERLFRGFDGYFVAYQTKTDIRRKRVTGVPTFVFAEWMEGAKLKEGSQGSGMKKCERCNTHDVYEESDLCEECIHRMITPGYNPSFNTEEMQDEIRRANGLD